MTGGAAKLLFRCEYRGCRPG